MILVAALPAFSQPATIVKFPELAARMSRQTDTTYIFNFFATWCEPCVHEFPNFQQFAKVHSSQKVKIVFVSLDFKKEFSKHLIPFLKKHRVREDVMLLDETDYNSWIDKVDSSWNGDLPATLILNNSKGMRKLISKECSEAELESSIKPFLP